MKMIQMYLTFAEHNEDFQKDKTATGGDFNLVLDIEKDKKGSLPKTNNNNSRKIVCKISELFNLVDAWRPLNPDTSRYSWC